MRGYFAANFENKSVKTEEGCVTENQRYYDSSMDRLEKEYIPTVYRVSKELIDKEVVLVIGATGSGKSTLTHYLMGHSLTFYEDPKTFAMVVKPSKKENEKRGPKIGEDNIDACTLYARAYPAKALERGSHLWICDCPGYNDTRGLAETCCTLISSQLAVRCPKSIKSIVVVVPWNALSGEGGSKSYLKELVQILSEMFGVKNLEMLVNSSVFFAISHLPERFVEKQTHELRMACEGILLLHIKKFTSIQAVDPGSKTYLKVLHILKKRIDQFIFPRLIDQGRSCDAILIQLQSATAMPKISFRVPETASTYFLHFIQTLIKFASLDKAQQYMHAIIFCQKHLVELQLELQHVNDQIEKLKKSLQKCDEFLNSMVKEKYETLQSDEEKVKICGNRIERYELAIRQCGLNSELYKNLEKEQNKLLAEPPSVSTIISVTRGTDTGRVAAQVGRVLGWSPIYGGIGGWMNALISYEKEVSYAGLPFIRIDTELPESGKFEIKECNESGGTFKGVYSVKSDGLGREAKIKVIVAAKVKHREKLKLIKSKMDNLRKDIKQYKVHKAIERQKLDELSDNLAKRHECVNESISNIKYNIKNLKHQLKAAEKERNKKQKKLYQLKLELKTNQTLLSKLSKPINLVLHLHKIFKFSDSLIKNFLDKYENHIQVKSGESKLTLVGMNLDQNAKPNKHKNKEVARQKITSKKLSTIFSESNSETVANKPNALEDHPLFRKQKLNNRS